MNSNVNSFICPKCGVISKADIKLYNEALRKQSFKISPILPCCLNCGSEIIVKNNELAKKENKLILLTGTCASGKSSTAEILMEKYNYGAIDTDCVMQVVKYKLNIQKIEHNTPEMYEEICNEIDILTMLDKDIVLSSVITTEDIDVYRRIFKARNINYKIFLLQPDYNTAVERSKKRTCHKSITPEVWVKYFYDKSKELENQKSDDLIIFDNTNYSVEESAEFIINNT